MTTFYISLAVLAVVSLLLAISKRTRPLVIAVTVLWLLGWAIAYFADSNPSSAIGSLIVAAGITAGAIRDRKKLIARLKG
ncbi:hypothetical protein [Streptomyces sp. MBT33]|uniref:hypothetical protein n=1 Tax=Streptomyces sp. MBT33 TaxID=1488363 RepID=UPI00190CF9AE|nr:hypothetical protein [Streptomyces sp. MBT33]MBK3640470.1 hypothetical protein [Streptomyces sp. MBT33]